MLDTRGIGREPAVFQERGKPQLATKLGELSIIADGDDEVTVLGGKCLIRRNVGMCVAEATRRLAACQKIHRLVGEDPDLTRSEEHTSELQSLMRISYAVFCLKKKNNTNKPTLHKA